MPFMQAENDDLYDWLQFDEICDKLAPIKRKEKRNMEYMDPYVMEELMAATVGLVTSIAPSSEVSSPTMPVWLEKSATRFPASKGRYSSNCSSPSSTSSLEASQLPLVRLNNRQPRSIILNTRFMFSPHFIRVLFLNRVQDFV